MDGPYWRTLSGDFLTNFLDLPQNMCFVVKNVESLSSKNAKLTFESVNMFVLCLCCRYWQHEMRHLRSGRC